MHLHSLPRGNARSMLLSFLLVFQFTRPASAFTTATANAPRYIPITYPTEIRYNPAHSRTKGRAGTNSLGLLLDTRSPTFPAAKQTGWVPAGGAAKTTMDGDTEVGAARVSMDGDGSMGGGGAWTSATFDDIPGVTGTAGAEGHGDFDETGVIERRPDVLGIAIGASISALALGVLLLWWFFWWRKYRSEKERRDREAWVRDLVVEVGGEKGKVV